MSEVNAMNIMSGEPSEKSNPSEHKKVTKSTDITVNLDINIEGNKGDDLWDFQITQKKLQEAIIWSEVLDKPVCRRRKRRYYGN